MLSKNNKNLQNISVPALFLCICIVRAQDTITFNDGMFATGAIKSVTADSVKIIASFTGEAVDVPVEKVGAIQMLGERYTFNKGCGVWEAGATDRLSDYFTQITLGNDREVSVLKYRGSPMVRSSKGFSSVIDSIYRTNFYEMRFRGYNVELSEEIVTNVNAIDFPLERIVSLKENPYRSGARQIIGGFICLGWGIAITNIGLLGIFSGLEETVLPIVFVGTGMITFASIRISIGCKYRKIHDKWDQIYKVINTP